MSLDKYSSKCINFITKNKNSFIKNPIKLSPQLNNFIKTITNAITHTDTVYTYTKSSTQLPRLTKTKFPLSYNYHKQDQHTNLTEFYKWKLNNIKTLPNENIVSDFGKEREYLHNILYKSYFISLDIQLTFESNPIKITTYVSPNNITVTVFSTGVKSININNIFHICTFMKKLSNDVDKVIKINLLPTSAKKLIKPNDTTLGPINVNSGYSQQNSHITIWRHEEHEKVLIHELIHYLNLDIKNTNTVLSSSLTSALAKKFSMDPSTITPNESYTESFAILINSIYVGYKLNIPFDKIIINEINFSLFQVAKILCHYGFDGIQSLKNMKQNSSILSYYIIKSAVILNFNKLFDNNYEKVVMESLTRDEFRRGVMWYIGVIRDNDEGGSFIWNTLRMSCMQLS